MKLKFNTSLRNTFFAIIAIGLGITGASAQQFWTGAGTWNTTNTNWGAVTGGPYSVTWANATSSIATFEGSGGTINVGASMNADRLDFNATGYELTATGARTLTGIGATNYNLAANVTATIGSNITLQSSGTSQNWTIDGANRDTSILNLNGIIRNNSANTSQIYDATVNLNSGGQLVGLTSIIVGTTTANSGSILNVAGTVSVGAAGSSLILNNTGGISANSTITLSNGGTINFTDATNANGIRFGATGANTNALTQHTSTLNLDGGTATVSRIFVGGTYGTNGSSLAAVVNFNGGTLKALNATNAAAFFQGFTQAATNSASSGGFVRAGGAKFDSNGFAITVGQALQSGVVGPALDGGLTLDDTAVTKGSLTLTATSTYTGATNVNSGTLIVNGNISTSSLTTVASGATIGGSGTVGALTINAGGFVNPGNSPGILNTGNYNQAGTLIAEITGLTAGTQHDQINVTGSVTLSGSLSILATGGTYAVDSMIFLILNDGTDAVNGTFAGLAQGATAATFGGFDWIISYEANSTGSSFLGGNDVALRAIPEPSTALLGGLGILALLRRRRR